MREPSGTPTHALLTGQVLRALKRDPLTDTRQLAIMLDITPDEVLERVAAAEASGVRIRRHATGD